MVNTLWVRCCGDLEPLHCSVQYDVHTLVYHILVTWIVLYSVCRSICSTTVERFDELYSKVLYVCALYGTLYPKRESGRSRPNPEILNLNQMPILLCDVPTTY
jgi:hypothetical protein